MEIPVPGSIFCPRCGSKVKMERISDESGIANLKKRGFATGCEGMCSCGVYAVLGIKRMPENPSFTLMFNIYKLREVGSSA